MAGFWNRQRSKLHPDDVRMTLGEHLEELRSRLIRAMIGLVIGTAICFTLIDYVMAFLTASAFTVLQAQGLPAVIKTYSPAESFMTELKVSIIVGLIISAPYSLAQIWGFIAAGLYPKERRWVSRFAPTSIVLFFVGAAFLLIVVSPLLLNFLVAYRTEYPNVNRFLPHWLVPNAEAITTTGDHETAPSWPTTQPIASFEHDPSTPPEGVPWLNRTEREIRMRFGKQVYSLAHLQKVRSGNAVEPEIRISEFVPFILQLAAAFGIGFQVPVVVAFLAAVGIVETKEMARLRRYVIFGMCIVAAVVTPPDPGSMIMLLVPMVLLFEAGLVAGRIIERKRLQKAA